MAFHIFLDTKSSLTIKFKLFIFHIVNYTSFPNKKKKASWSNNKWYWWLLKCLELGQKVGSKCTKCIDQLTLRKTWVSNQWKGTLASGACYCFDLHLDPLWQPSSQCYILYCISHNWLMLCKNNMPIFFFSNYYIGLFKFKRKELFYCVCELTVT